MTSLTPIRRFRCHRYKTKNCPARVLRVGNQFSLIGSHSEHHPTEETEISNMNLTNAVKERCLFEPGSIKDIFDEESLK
jgi:hypothetical protein